MADTTTTTTAGTSGVSSDSTHQEGINYIKDKVAEEHGSSAQGTAPVASASATETSKPEPNATLEPPASNPGAGDKTGGMAKDAGGLSGAAHKESPVPNSDKRKSIMGSLKGYLGFDKKNAGQQSSATAPASAPAHADQTYVGAASAAVSGAAVATAETVAYYTGMGSHPHTAETAPSSAAPVTTAATSTTDGASDPHPAVAVATSEENPRTEKNEENPPPAQTGSTSGDDNHKPPQAMDSTARENKSAIPSAGGEKLGEKHWGESKVVPDDPSKAKNESGVSSAEGQPTKEVSDNTSKNTGGAAGPAPSGSTTAGTSGTTGAESPKTAEKKEKSNFLDKLKEKLPHHKKKA